MSLAKFAVGAGLSLAASVAVQSPNRVPVSWVPQTPIEGSIALLAVGPDTTRNEISGVRGTVAGEPLHFTRGEDGAYRAFIPVPVGSPGRVFASLEIAKKKGAADQLLVRIPVARREVEVERVRVPGRYVEPPDSALLARIERERAAQRAALNRAHRTQRIWSGKFSWPGLYRVTGTFGARREINGATQSVHLGLDLGAPEGTPVLAPARGVVSLVGDFFYQGKLVYLDHGSGLSTGYFHLSEVLVNRGDTVEAGQAIGLVGATGRVTGPHLHWVARYGRLSIDPQSLLELSELERGMR
ncbi:Murein DD-endopeptidase MepM [bacterium HR33]|nr:Murein DD-endopeptidase MepM [bacterium HR33]